MNRRYFIKSTSLGAVSLGFVGMPKFFVNTLHAQELGNATPGISTNSSDKILVNIFMRGAVDGLNVVVPYGEDNYYKFRNSIAIPRPSASNEAALDLDGFFGLNPRMQNILSMFKDKEVAFVHASGSPNGTRSHFEAQAFMESGTPGVATTETGWLNRTMTRVPKAELGIRNAKYDPFELVAIEPMMPLSTRGDFPALSFDSINELRFRARNSDNFASALTEMYSDNPRMSESMTLLKEAMRIAEKSREVSINDGAYPPYPLASKLREVAKLIKMNIGLKIAFLDVTGWDTHVNEGGIEKGVLPNLLKQFDESIKAFRDDLGDKFGDVVVVTLSEFGRTVHENGNGGTDHGHANVMMVFGGNIKGGRVAGRWPGLANNELYQDRDLAVTTDFRTVLSEVITKHLGVKDIQPVFPDFAYRGSELVIG